MSPVKRLIDWYIHKFWEEEYVRKDRLRDLLIKTKENEARRINIRHERLVKELRSDLELEKLAEVEELNAEIVRLESIIEESSKRVKHAETVYFNAVKKSKSNARISGEMNFQMGMILELVGEIAGQMQGIETRASLHAKSMIAEQKDVTSKLKEI